MEGGISPPPPKAAAPARAPPPPCSGLTEVMVKGREMSKRLQILLSGIFRAGDHQAAHPPHRYSSSSSLIIKAEPPPPPPRDDDHQKVLKVEAEPTTSEGILHLHLAAATDLVGDILRSFTQGIAILDGAADNHDDDYGGSCCCCCKSTNTTATSAAAAAGKKKLPPAGRDGRGTYKRRRTDDTWTKETTNLDDGHAWRKYGQKAILGTNNPRSYFRCTHKYEQGCEASKQVQLKEDGSGLYVVTYMGHHTCCRDPQYKPSPILIIDSEVVPNNIYDQSAGGYVLMNFQQQEQQQEAKTMSFSFTTTTSGKQQSLELMKKSSSGSSRRTATDVINHNTICSTSSQNMSGALSSHGDQLHGDNDHDNHDKYLAVLGRPHDQFGYLHKPAVLNVKEICMSSDEGAGDNMQVSGVCSSSVSSSYNYMQEGDQDNSTSVDDSVSIQDILINFDDHEDWFSSHTF